MNGALNQTLAMIWMWTPSKGSSLLQGILITSLQLLIREGIQNALDERNRGGQMETVRVRIFLSGEKYALSNSEYNPIIETLKPHLRSDGSGLSTLPDFSASMKFLVFEDFNTKGLEGNPRRILC